MDNNSPRNTNSPWWMVLAVIAIISALFSASWFFGQDDYMHLVAVFAEMAVFAWAIKNYSK